MDKFVLKFILIAVLFLVLIVPGALFMEVISHELYHYYNHQEYSSEICFNVNEATAYTIVNFPDETTKLGYNQDIRNAEEEKADLFGKIASFTYSFTVLIILGAIIYLNKK